jgi:GntP family gluconate:H+ symporter
LVQILIQHPSNFLALITIDNPFVIVALGMIIVIGGIIGLRLHAFLALLLSAFVVAFLTSPDAIMSYATEKGLSMEAAQDLAYTPIGVRIATEFGRTCGKIGILIAMASIIGKCLLESGAAEKMVRSSLKVFGEKRAPLTFLGSSFFIGIPVFFDTVFYLMVPLAKAMAMKIGKNYLLLILSITAGAAMANSLVPPTPGPLFLIGEMNIPIGMMIIGGCAVGIVTVLVGYAYAFWANKKWEVPLRDSIDAPLEQIQSLSSKESKNLPSLSIAILPIAIPILLITMKAGFDSFININELEAGTGLAHIAYGFIDFFGEKNMAMISGAIAALLMLAYQKKFNKKYVLESVQAALMSSGMIILITSAGGAFGGVLQQTGISASMSTLTHDYQMAVIPMAFLITAVVRTAQGSATVAMITCSGILSGLATTQHLEFHQLYIGLAIACGSKLIPWMNDSGFWIVCKMSNLTEQEALKTYTPLLTLMGLAGLIVIMIGAKLFPLI